jgi:hypothetical protein
MMTKKNELAAATQEATDLVPVGSELPAWIPKADVALGAEHMTKDDARIPRLALAQGLSHQMLRGDPLYIEDLKIGDAFNDLTNEIYGESVQIAVVRADPPRYIEFADDRSIVDPNVRADDPRTQFTTDEAGNRIPPVATKFYDYVVLIGPGMEPVAFSCSKTAIKHTAQRLNGLLRARPIPIFSCRYKLNSKMMKNDEGSWAVFSVEQAGFLDEESYKKAEGYFNLFKEKQVEFERQPGDDDPGQM